MKHLGGKEAAVSFFKGEKWTVVTGLLGFVLAGLCAVWVLVNGGAAAPEGDVTKAVSFNAALGLFLLSTAAIIPFSGLGPVSKAVFRWSYIILVLYSYFAETVQNFRGVNPRFTVNDSAFDTTVSILFGSTAILMILLYLFFAVQFFRRKTYKQRPALVLGIRYAMIAVMISFAAGFWLSANIGRFTGLNGNIIWFHGLGFHALQALPFVAWLTEQKTPSSPVRHRLIHITGIAFLLGLLAIGWQTYLGYTVFTWSTLPLIAFGCFLIALAPVLLVFSKRANKGSSNVNI